MIAGCGGAWRPPINGVQREDVPSVFRLAEYFPDQPGWRWTYQRLRDGREEGTYVRQFEEGAYAEGALIGRAFLPLETYLAQPDGTASQPAATRPAVLGRKPPPRRRAPLGGELGVIIVFDPPLPALPADVHIDEPIVWRSRLQCFGKSGDHWYNGSVRRRVQFEGLQDVRVGQLDFLACLRLRITTGFHFFWGPIFELTQYVWLARGVGEVRRVERVAGLELLLPFSAIERLDLIDYTAPTTGATEPSLLTRDPRPWRALALELSETLPQPRIAGLRVELAEQGPPPSEVASRYDPAKMRFQR